MANIREAKAFVKSWKDRGDEKQETQAFWIQLLDKVYEDHNYHQHILFEQVADKVEGGANFKDVVINRYTDHAVLIEQKSSSLTLDKPEPRFGKLVTPFEQAKHYDDLSAYNDKSRWIITCNFKQFWIYDMTKTGKELYVPVAKLKLDELPNHLDWLSIIVSKNDNRMEFIDEVAVSKEAGELVGVIYDALKKRYPDPDSPETARELNKLCVRLVFCLYAEDAGLFDRNNRKIFHDYLSRFDARQARKALIDLFKVLNQKTEERDQFLADDDPILASFPYVNGGLFKDDVMIPPFDDEIREILLVKESMGFDWSKISPTIFGAVFESTLNPETRRAGGMHYTTVENIHRVIDPLFLDELTNELNAILEGKQANVRDRKLRQFQNKLSSLTFFDPAAGSGNFLTETYLSLRRLENRIIQSLNAGKMALDFEGENSSIKVSIDQFFGIEINDFAVSVAKTALWIAESQMFQETQAILSSDKEFLPLRDFNNIHEGNALRISWYDVLDPRQCSYIMGNPPFRGSKYLNADQKKDLAELNTGLSDIGLLDYVCGWYIKAGEYMQGTPIATAFVSTNSITQGGIPNILWKYLFERYNSEINFAYRTFVWDSEANDKASVHCVIIGFSDSPLGKQKIIHNSDESTLIAKNISPYLIDAPSITVGRRRKPLCAVPEMIAGNKGVKTLALQLSREEKEYIIKQNPKAEKYIKKLIGAEEFINNKDRYCLWLVGCTPKELIEMPEVLKRVEQVRKDRLSSTDKQAKKLAETPMLFRDTFNPDQALVIPLVSSQNRQYIPIGYIDSNTIANNKVSIIPNGDYYMFGILNSSVHNSWMRVVSMRMKSDYSYSLAIVYNNFPWPTLTPDQKAMIEKTAQSILNARDKYPDASLADLYGEYMYLYPELVNAHKANDAAVMAAYGFNKDLSEEEIVSKLMQMYADAVKNDTNIKG